MGAGASSQISSASEADLSAVVAALTTEDKAKLSAALGEQDKLPSLLQKEAEAVARGERPAVAVKQEDKDGAKAEQQQLAEVAEAAGVAVAAMPQLQQDTSKNAWNEFDGALLEAVEIGGRLTSTFGTASEDALLEDPEARFAEDEARLEAVRREPLPEGSPWHDIGGGELEPLLVHTDIIDAAWLLKLANGEVMPERKGVVPAWQDVPPDAKLSLAMLRRMTMKFRLPVAVLSYGWASRGHPDPTGALLRRLKPVLERMMHCCKNGASPQVIPEDLDDRTAVWGIVWDVRQQLRVSNSPSALLSLRRCHPRPPCLACSCLAHISLAASRPQFMSLPQRGYTTGYVPDELGPDGKIIKSNDDRTPYQLKRFGRGLKSINIWYGSMYTTTLVCDWEMPEAAENAAPIDKRGTPETTASKDCAL